MCLLVLLHAVTSLHGAYDTRVCTGTLKLQHEVIRMLQMQS